MRFRVERGFLLVGLVTMMAIFGIMSGVAVQEWSTIEKREREAQLIFIQEQYAAAILAYQAEKGVYPTTLDQLGERGGNNQRYIRKLYTDPMIRDSTVEDWCLLTVNPTGQVSSSCASKDGGGLRTSDGGRFRIGSSSGQQGQQNRRQGQSGGIQGLQAGQTAIAGVHSRSREPAFNVLKRGEDSYDRWIYTFEDYRSEMDARGIPGVPTAQEQAPGRGTLPGQQGQPGQIGQPGTGTRAPGNRPVEQGKPGTRGPGRTRDR